MVVEVEKIGLELGWRDRIVDVLNEGLYYRFEACGQKPRRVKEITGMEIVNGELHVRFRDTEGGCWVQEFKGEGWRGLLGW